MLWCVLTLPPLAPNSSTAPLASPSPASEAPSASDWQSLACWAGRYTPRVALEGLGLEGPVRQDSGAVPALSFEVSGSLSLFGGREALLADVRAGLRQWPWPLTLGVAVRRRAALWLALAGIADVAESLAALPEALRPVPLAVLPWSAVVAQRLTGFGLRCLGEVLDLPRSALALRLGADFVLDLARALGEVEEPVRWLVFPEHFEQGLELPAAVETAPVLLFACRRLLAALAGWLAVRNAAVSEVLWHFAHERVGRPDTVLPLRFSDPVHGQERMEAVLREALGRLVLPAPVLRMRLVVRTPVLRDARSQTLFAGAPGAGECDSSGALAELIDRLQARLDKGKGVGAVGGLRCHADHRPERATREVPQGFPSVIGAGETATCGVSLTAAAPPTAIPSRPLCLLNVAQPLREHHGRPWLNGPLRLLAGPERIESGWWDGADVTRDYFVALDVQQRWCWVYRTGGESAGWYLHGLFA